MPAMDIFDDEALRRPGAFVLKLQRLPTELIHKVLNDLPLVKVLQIAAHKDQHLDHAIVTHQHWRRLFSSQGDIDLVTDTFILYNEICRFTRTALANALDFINRPCYSGLWGRARKVVDIKKALLNAIECMLPKSVKEVALLQVHSQSDITAQADIQSRWDVIKNTKRKLNMAKAKQLTLVADLLAKHPEMLMIKKPLDPQQEPPRQNLKHIESRFRSEAKKVLNNGRLRLSSTNHLKCKLGLDHIEIVPYDRYLWIFLDTLRKHPYGDDSSSSEVLDKKIDGLELDTPDQEQEVMNKPFRYPLEIRRKLDTVHAGLAYIYTGCVELIIERIRWTCDPPTGRPSFHIQSGKHHEPLSVEHHRCGIDSNKPYDNREYEWLCAFLEVVIWMEETFGKSEL